MAGCMGICMAAIFYKVSQFGSQKCACFCLHGAEDHDYNSTQADIRMDIHSLVRSRNIHTHAYMCLSNTKGMAITHAQWGNDRMGRNPKIRTFIAVAIGYVTQGSTELIILSSYEIKSRMYHTLMQSVKRVLSMYIGTAKYLFFGKCFKKTTEYFLKYLFLFESTILPVKNGK